MGLGKPHQPANFEVATSSRCKNINGEPPILGSSPSPGPRPLFPLGVILWWSWANPSCIANLKSLAHGHAHFSSAWNFIMGLGKPQCFAKFEVADFIYYGNIREFVFVNWDKPKWGNTLLFGETDYTVGFADPMFSIRCDTVVELRLQQMGDFYEKPHFTMENFKFRGL